MVAASRSAARAVDRQLLPHESAERKLMELWERIEEIRVGPTADDGLYWVSASAPTMPRCLLTVLLLVLMALDAVAHPGRNGGRRVPLLPHQLRLVECRGRHAPLPRWRFSHRPRQRHDTLAAPDDASAVFSCRSNRAA